METVTVTQALELVTNLVGYVAFALYLSVYLTPRRWNRLWTGLAWATAFCAVDGLFSVFFVNIPLDPSEWSLPSLLALLAVLYGITYIFYRPQPGKQLFLLCIGLAISGVFNIISAYVRLVLFSGGTPVLPANVFISVTALLVALPILLARVCVPKSFIYQGRLETLALLLPCAPLIIIRGFVYSGEIVKSHGAALILASVFMFATVILSIHVVQRLTLHHMEDKDAAILREQIKELRGRDAGSGWAEIRGMRHDMKNHLNTMRRLLESPAPESAPALQAYLGKMDETLERSEFAFPTGHPVTDAVIHGKHIEAMRMSIRFTCEFARPSSLSVDVYDLAVILQNALENAVEACERVPEEKRFIGIRSRVKAEMFFVEVSNSYAGVITIDSQTGLPVTSKRDTCEHGLGLSNIKRSAKKHRGDITIQLTEKDGVKVFTLTAALQG